METVRFSSRTMRVSYDLSDLERLTFRDLLPLKSAKMLISLEMPDGEASKTPEAVQRVMEVLAMEQFTRSDTVIALGGGSLSDMAGFASSVFKRGIGCIFIPTTLLSMVDASIGGKNGINFAGLKNSVGTFYHPDAVIISAGFISSLPDDQYQSGLGEVLKYAVSLDVDLYNRIISKRLEILKRDLGIIKGIIARCISLKIAVVKSDELETNGKREVLNFGHTIGHAIESVSSFTVSHGLAVVAGMLAECSITEALGITKPGTLDRLDDLVAQFMPSLLATDLDSSFLKFIRNDKKIRNGKIRLPVLEEIGKSRVDEIDITKFEEAFNDIQIRSNWK
ncbi:3-dehydroquinate synthase [Thermoplasmatales archaeon AK]|nr:3-dehydroquinate synthase [Thermoplasmatales archaeon AK]